MKVNPDAAKKLAEFIEKPKFEQELNTAFNGLSHPEIKIALTSLINQAAKDFLATVDNHPTEEKFEQDIGTGLKRFNKYFKELDSEDEDRICHYFEELMDCVGLQSSNGQINEWRYGFDPTQKR